ncbi:MULTISPECIES: DUF2147 domain-containing protein [Weeksella]|uniref:DUF2147 domain-containing protein n=1 Tax=Weeksella virosa (strain ATCC 43766 / DSM 16922 / JCM 21250 / CCUG 30538 / CDC 9751 / IAM 14551 / NBRC 16016 / NCTC 11634 / CL345/78) TaxID=865938 RepID=F0NXU6_WEEVC|nr:MULTISPECIES: DUF2147 domain-containing protein [Weeksella]ADX68014.1 Protein of unknown function DUF2147 [Weeksella virosa DSM 16922]MDK7375913.1 DUF2147 domain-containing protein [Weeksella virosa]MDK7676192.1 DUF2147 domain-containing protein [Weeksella virosa]OFM83807.1 hypothetical protein HMPREF2660_09770 [Weeksella sp. HMSC059D05]SUP54322.1 Uncharacterized protein conserved in bacteria [Weeksella virosa]
MIRTILFSMLLMVSSILVAQSPIGKWKTIDDETGAAKSIVEIFENNGKLYGKVVEILTPGKQNLTCTKCKGNLKDKPVVGLQIIRGLKKDGKEWGDGVITDPVSGKEYKAKLSMSGNNTLNVRGYVGISLIGRTQTWTRVK